MTLALPELDLRPESIEQCDRLLNDHRKAIALARQPRFFPGRDKRVELFYESCDGLLDRRLLLAKLEVAELAQRWRQSAPGGEPPAWGQASEAVA